MVTSGPFNTSQNSEYKKGILAAILHEVRLTIPDFLIVMGPIISSKDPQLLQVNKIIMQN